MWKLSRFRWTLKTQYIGNIFITDKIITDVTVIQHRYGSQEQTMNHTVRMCPTTKFKLYSGLPRPHAADDDHTRLPTGVP